MNDEILIRHLLGETTEEENKSIQAWIDKSPEHKKQYDHIKLIWETSKTLPYKSNIDPEMAWARFQKKRSHYFDRNGKRNVSKPIQIPALKFAAVFLVATLVAFLSYFLWIRDSGYLFAVHLNSENSVITDTLADGSIITLNKQTMLDFSRPILKNQRIIEMQSGEAFFSVAHDNKNPFIVHTPRATITVVGTSFNIKNTTLETEIIVETGIIQVEADHQSMPVNKGEKLIIDSESGELSIDKTTDRLYSYYIDNTFELIGTPLWRVAEVLESVFGKKVTVRKEIRELPLTTTLKADNLEDILKVIETTFNIQVIEKDNRIVIQ